MSASTIHLCKYYPAVIIIIYHDNSFLRSGNIVDAFLMHSADTSIRKLTSAPMTATFRVTHHSRQFVKAGRISARKDHTMEPHSFGLHTKAMNTWCVAL